MRVGWDRLENFECVFFTVCGKFGNVWRKTGYDAEKSTGLMDLLFLKKYEEPEVLKFQGGCALNCSKRKPNEDVMKEKT